MKASRLPDILHVIRESRELQMDWINNGQRCKNKLLGNIKKRSLSVRVPKNSIKSKMKIENAIKAKYDFKQHNEELN